MLHGNPVLQGTFMGSNSRNETSCEGMDQKRNKQQIEMLHNELNLMCKSRGCQVLNLPEVRSPSRSGDSQSGSAKTCFLGGIFFKELPTESKT
jgi:hypothetical protein